MEQPIDILERYWNFTSFKPLQKPIITSVLEGQDTFALLPTGGGKSVCFQVPALSMEGICVVISPLIALMKDQVRALKDKGIKAVALTSDLKYNDLQNQLDNCLHGNYKFLYLSPERLQQELVQDRIRQMPVNLLAVDEAHCISHWGNDFRPAYKHIVTARELHPDVPVIALTASATPAVVTDIVNELQLRDPQIFKQSFLRQHLAYMVYETEDKLYMARRTLKKYQGPAIVYVRSRKAAFDFSDQLNKSGITSVYYHGGLSNDEKEKYLRQWFNEAKQVMVATSAFGMGIDKANVKTVIHINLPESLESYFQEAGRAGRNDDKAFAVILRNASDEARVKRQFLAALPGVKFVKKVYRKLGSYFQISFGEGEHTVHDFKLNEFCAVYGFNTAKTYNALKILDRLSIISLSEQFGQRSQLYLKVPGDTLLDYLAMRPQLNTIVKFILRTYGGLFDQFVKINTHLIAAKAEVNEDAVIEALIQLQKDDLADLKLAKTDTQIIFMEPREDDRTINRIAPIIRQQNDFKESQVASVLEYVNNTDICKSVQLLRYFGELDSEPCGICSVCLNREKARSKPEAFKAHIDSIRVMLQERALSSRELVERSDLPADIITKVLQAMLEDEQVRVTDSNTYTLL